MTLIQLHSTVEQLRLASCAQPFYKVCLCVDRFQDNALAPGKGAGKHCDLQGGHIRTLDPGMVDMEPLQKKYGVRPLLLSWHAARQFLFEALPADTVQFNSQV